MDSGYCMFPSMNTPVMRHTMRKPFRFIVFSDFNCIKSVTIRRMKPGYSIDLRERVVAYVEQGGSKAAAVALFQVSRRSIYYGLQRKRETGKLLPKALKPYKVRKLDKTQLAKFVEICPDATLQETADHFGVWPSTVWYALKRLKITRKKNGAVPGAKRR